uniref:Uncharacterized protein n=1 Tax=Glossina morsitans morsitans TaxID=37546 RepID=A0A1B0FFI3_GLOMM
MLINHRNACVEIVDGIACRNKTTIDINGMNNKMTMAGEQASKQASKQAGKQAGRHASESASKQESKQASKQADKLTGS